MFLVMTKKIIFIYKLLLSLNVSDFSFFYVKTATPPWKKSPPFSQQAPLKIEILSSPLPFFKIWSVAQPPSPSRIERGVHTMIN